MKENVAVIGSGIAGMASAYYLRDRFDVHLFESQSYIGGHTNTRFVSESAKSLPIDTGFMVFNDHTYPNLVRLFNELEVTTYPTSMSFGVRNIDTGLEYSSAGAKGFFAQSYRIADPRHWKLYSGIKKFFRLAIDSLDSGLPTSFTIADFAKAFKIPERTMQDFVVPMAGAIWSTPPEGILQFPALPMLRFMNNHRMLGIGTQYQWKTVEGGSQQYKDKLLAKLHHKPIPGLGVEKIHQTSSEARLTLSDGTRRTFDHAIIATHADDALRLIGNPNQKQETLLSPFKYNSNTAVLHSDASVMPNNRNAWASWNVSHQGRAGQRVSATHYWMNSLQNLDTDQNYFVSVDFDEALDPDLVHWQTVYTHPRFDSASIAAQSEIATLNASGALSFCGSYFRNGFHEDALWSALNATKSLLDRKEASHAIAPL